jgi:hypothetical protein
MARATARRTAAQLKTEVSEITAGPVCDADARLAVQVLHQFRRQVVL